MNGYGFLIRDYTRDYTEQRGRLPMSTANGPLFRLTMTGAHIMSPVIPKP